ncbi:TonB family protein [Spirosoma sp. BT702]|uniref:TonB family protein n=1 Tax=Spirosoma profusum TaxID=2771354 RepID=A0A927GA44_9BACT|nr:energy transducer TonB [Spirosoma profusum]MBD2704919.1 TonB family protein [Spirosoma profusum]
MNRLILITCILSIAFAKTFGQYTVYQDTKGHVLTRFDQYASQTDGPRHNEVLYQGSPFLTYPVWQAGKVRLDESGQVLVCELAYNLVTNEVLCRFPDDLAVKIVTPSAFTINDIEFIRQPNKSIAVKQRLYLTILHQGPTKLLASYSKQAKPAYGNNTGYDKDLAVKGYYQDYTKYYIQKGDASPEFISLSKNSLVSVLYEQSEQIAAKISNKELTPDIVAKTLLYYDTLMATTRANKSPLRYEPIFAQLLRDKITYPNRAWNQGIYGRVYIGFEVTEQGSVKNVQILSPGNDGIGFTDMVRNAFNYVPDLNPSLRGQYALPVTFTYTNVKEKADPHVPVNQLPTERLGDRTLLEEFIVPSTVNKPVITSREVWGYYK